MDGVPRLEIRWLAGGWLAARAAAKPADGGRRPWDSVDGAEPVTSTGGPSWTLANESPVIS